MSNICSGYELVVKQLAQSRPTLDYLDNIIFPCGGVKPKSLIEISGASNTGKSLILQHLIARCLPPTYFGGKYCDVILIDLGHKLSVHYLNKMLKRIIDESGEKYSTAEMDDVMQKCLDSVTTLNCFSSDDFELAFDIVEDILWDNQNIALLAIDALDAYYWMDTQKQLIRMTTHYTKLIAKIKQICDKHNICCLYTVDSNYIELKTKLLNPNVWPTNKIEYKLKLSLASDGNNICNERKFKINEFGIHFIK